MQDSSQSEMHDLSDDEFIDSSIHAREREPFWYRHKVAIALTVSTCVLLAFVLFYLQMEHLSRYPKIRSKVVKLQCFFSRSISPLYGKNILAGELQGKSQQLPMRDIIIKNLEDWSGISSSFIAVGQVWRKS
jgi:hypothetical protein